MAVEHQHATIPLGELLHQYQLGLVVIAGTSPDVAERLVQWVHVSELEDPTPFLTPRTVLLTTGARFSAMRRHADAEAYVTRLIDSGVTALGIAVGLHWDRVPARFVAACDQLGLPLFRVPYDTPFIAVVQTAARLLEARDRERDLWALESQRAVANASLHRDGLGAAVREAASRLSRWVCVTDRGGRIIEFAPESARAEAPIDDIRREVRHLVERGVSAGRIGSAAGGLQMQALGQPGHALGVLVAEDQGAPDAAERALLGLVSALATVQLEHRAGIDAAQLTLREAIVTLLMERQGSLAAHLAAESLLRVPQGSLVVVRYQAASEANDALTEDITGLDAATPGLFRSRLDGTPVIISEARHAGSIRRVFAAHGVAAGISERGPADDLAMLASQADRALAQAVTSHDGGPLDYVRSQHESVLQLVGEHPEARTRAASLLAPLREHDRRNHDDVTRHLSAWLEHHGQTSAAAAALDVHRHTITSRVRTAAELLQVNLDSPDVRAELWAALRLTR